jgi:hypothetical protein
MKQGKKSGGKQRYVQADFQEPGLSGVSAAQHCSGSGFKCSGRVGGF